MRGNTHTSMLHFYRTGINIFRLKRQSILRIQNNTNSFYLLYQKNHIVIHSGVV